MFAILMGVVGVVGLSVFWKRVIEPRGAVADSCVSCGGDNLDWDLGELESDIDDVYKCRDCGHVGGPGQQYVAEQAELARFRAKDPHEQWRQVLKTWREAVYSLEQACNYKAMNATSITEGSTWPLRDEEGRHHYRHAALLLEQLTGMADLVALVAEAVGDTKGRPEECLVHCVNFEELLAHDLVSHLRDRGVGPTCLRGELEWLSRGARGTLLVGLGRLVTPEEVLELGEHLPWDAAVEVVASMLAHHGDDPQLEQALITLLTAEGKAAAAAVGEALAEVGTMQGLRALESPPPSADRAQRAIFADAAATLRDRLARNDGRLSIIVEEAVEGALSEPERQGEVSLVD